MWLIKTEFKLKIEQGADERDLIQLKYALLKNLSFINKDKTGNFSKALNFIIQVLKTKRIRLLLRVV